MPNTGIVNTALTAPAGHVLLGQFQWHKTSAPVIWYVMLMLGLLFVQQSVLVVVIVHKGQHLTVILYIRAHMALIVLKGPVHPLRAQQEVIVKM